MIIRVPLLLNIVDAVVHRLDVAATRAFDPPGPATSGYDDAFRSPVVYDEADGASVAARQSARQEKAAVRVPCQVETQQHDQLRAGFIGNLPQSTVVLVTHRKDLQTLGLVDTATGRPAFGIGDRVSAIEKHNMPGVVTRQFPGEGLFITEIRPGSFGFGPDGYDLDLLILEDRERGTA